MGVGGNEVHVGEHGKDSRGVWEKGNSQEVDWRLRHMGGRGWGEKWGTRCCDVTGHTHTHNRNAGLCTDGNKDFLTAGKAQCGGIRPSHRGVSWGPRGSDLGLSLPQPQFNPWSGS